ncbi:hypothetical protein ACE2AJ_14640 [Aquihabitans daechungensis]|uniref:hypothetical protein n=1 Tax=Aquihabitans daechungensis TaxID=1052257 RepID=UPI003BA2749B
MTTLELAVDSFVSSSAGPVLCENLAEGTELVVVGRDGQFRSGVIEQLDQVGEQEVAQMLTSVGDLKVPLTTAIITRQGLERADDLADSAAGSTRVELVRPADMPRREGQWRVTKADVLAALEALNPPAIMIPATRPGLDRSVAAIVGHLERSGAPFDVIDSDRWTTIVFEHRPATGAGDLRAQVAVLSDLTAWTDDDGPMRTRMCDDRLRRRMLAALVARGIAPAVQWVPAYRPAECHVSEQPEWKPFSPVPSIQVRREPVVRVRVSEVGHLVCGLAVVGSAA